MMSHLIRQARLSSPASADSPEAPAPIAKALELKPGATVAECVESIADYVGAAGEMVHVCELLDLEPTTPLDEILASIQQLLDENKKLGGPIVEPTGPKAAKQQAASSSSGVRPVAFGRPVPLITKPPALGVLSKQELASCKRLGIDPKEYAAKRSKLSPKDRARLA